MRYLCTLACKLPEPDSLGLIQKQTSRNKSSLDFCLGADLRQHFLDLLALQHLLNLWFGFFHGRHFGRALVVQPYDVKAEFALHRRVG